jgi:hypothetical protein
MAPCARLAVHKDALACCATPSIVLCPETLGFSGACECALYEFRQCTRGYCGWQMGASVSRCGAGNLLGVRENVAIPSHIDMSSYAVLDIRDTAPPAACMRVCHAHAHACLTHVPACADTDRRPPEGPACDVHSPAATAPHLTYACVHVQLNNVAQAPVAYVPQSHTGTLHDVRTSVAAVADGMGAEQSSSSAARGTSGHGAACPIASGSSHDLEVTCIAWLCCSSTAHGGWDATLRPQVR